MYIIEQLLLSKIFNKTKMLSTLVDMRPLTMIKNDENIIVLLECV